MQLLRDGKSFSGHERNCAYLNCGTAGFANVSAVSGLDFPDDGRAVCVTDWDQDGDQDVWLHNRTGPRLRLMRNRLRDADRGQESQTHFVTFRLRGTTSNQDAIGARVTVWQEDDTRPQTQTLHAGDAFLSQSSKWLHFGLGAGQRVSRVTVQWPNGVVQEYHDLAADRRYQLTEGDAIALVLPVPDRALALDDTEQPPVAAEAAIRTVLANRLPLPILPYRKLDGEQRTIASSGTARLVVLWASWCPACQRELSDLRQHRDTLKNAGIETLLIALDGLDTEQVSGVADVQATAERLSLTFPVGIAERALLEKLELAESVLLNRPPPLAVPLNLLIDGDGALAAIYRGPLDIDALFADVGQLDTPLVRRRDQAVPFAGTWTSPPRQMLLRAVGHWFQEHGFDEDHVRYLRLDAEMLERQLQLAKTPDERRRISNIYAATNYTVGVGLLAQNESVQAEQYFRRAVETNPRHVDATVNLAVLYAKRRNVQEAIRLLRRAIDLDPDSIAARTNLANAMSAAGDFEAASEHFRHIVKLGVASPAIHSRLARSLIETGHVADAAEQLEKAIELGARDAATLVSLAWIRATSPNDSLRDGQRASELATRLRAERLGPLPLALDILAAAYAEQGDFDKAITVATQAQELLDGRQTSLREPINARIDGYRQSRPHRDDDSRYP